MAKLDRGEISIGLMLALLTVCTAITLGIVAFSSFAELHEDHVPRPVTGWTWQFFALPAALVYMVAIAWIIRMWTTNRARAIGMAFGLVAVPLGMVALVYVILITGR